MNYDSWVKRGEKDFLRRASEAIDKILAEHTPEPLPTKTRGELGQIVQKAKAG